MWIKTLLSILVFCCLVVISISAQSREGSIEITVKDQLDAVISNAEIVLSNFNKKQKNKKTNALGETQFSKILEGEYQIIITHKGFLEYKSELLVLKSGEVKKIEIVLEVAPVESQVDVTNEDSVQADDYGMVTTLTEEDIQKLPDDPEEFLKALRRIAGESITGDDLPIRVNDITGERIPPKQLIEQIRIDRNAFSAKYAGMGGGGIQIYTSSSEQTYRGNANFSFADSRLNATDPFVGRRVPFQSRNYRLDLSGPLGKKASFSISGGRNERNSSVAINAVILDSSLQPVEYRDVFFRPNRGQNLGLRINYSPSKKHKFYANYNFNQGRGTGQGVGFFSLPERAMRSEQQGHSVALSHTYIGSPTFFSRSTLIARYNSFGNFADNDRPSINVAEAFSAGGGNTDSVSRNFNFEFSNDTNRQIGKLSVEYGFSASYIGNYQDSRSNFNGTYNFNGRIAPLLDENNAPRVDEAGNIITGQITSLESYRRTLLFRRLGYPVMRIRELGGGADQFSISGGETAISVSQIEYSLYLQGSYNIRKNLGVSFGVRYENQNNIKSPFNFAPRVSVIWSPKKKDKENLLWSLPRISAGIGMSYSRFGVGNTLSIRQINEDGRAFYLLSAANAIDSQLSSIVLDSFPNAPSIDLLQQLSLPRTRRFFEPGFQVPYDLTSNLSLNKKLPAKFGAFVSISHSRGFRRQITRNINAPLAGTFDMQNPAKAIYPFDNKGNIYQISDIGKSELIRFSANLTMPPMKMWKKSGSLMLRYVTSRSRDDMVTGSGSPFDAYDFSGEFGQSANSGVHILSGNFSQSLPFKFAVSGTWSIRTGTRFNITTGRDSNGDGIYSERPSFASNPNKPGVIKTMYGYLDPNPAPGDKIIPRNLGRGPGATSFDMALNKTIGFGIDEKNKKQPKRMLMMSMFVSNVFNIVNRGNPIGNMASPRFVRILSGASSDLNPGTIGNGFIGSGFTGGDFYGDYGSGGSPRSINFSVNFSF